VRFPGFDCSPLFPLTSLPLQNFLDLPHLRRTYGPFLTFSEFFDLYQLPPSSYDETQVWNASAYNPEGLTTATLPQDVFQNRTFIRVDEALRPFPLAETIKDIDGLNASSVEKALASKPAWTLPKAKEALSQAGAQVGQLEEGELLAKLATLGVVSLHTFDDECVFLSSFHSHLSPIADPSSCRVLMNKAAARPSIEVALRSKVQSLTTTLSAPPYADASIVYLQGDLHDQRKPGGVYFTSAEARDGFIEMVLKGIRAPSKVQEVGAILSQRMGIKVNGRRWVAAHLRRGDFVSIAWSPCVSRLILSSPPLSFCAFRFVLPLPY
jgi:hypothetical protein